MRSLQPLSLITFYLCEANGKVNVWEIVVNTKISLISLFFNIKAALLHWCPYNPSSNERSGYNAKCLLKEKVCLSYEQAPHHLSIVLFPKILYINRGGTNGQWKDLKEGFLPLFIRYSKSIWFVLLHAVMCSFLSFHSETHTNTRTWSSKSTRQPVLLLRGTCLWSPRRRVWGRLSRGAPGEACALWQLAPRAWAGAG